MVVTVTSKPHFNDVLISRIALFFSFVCVRQNCFPWDDIEPHSIQQYAWEDASSEQKFLRVKMIGLGTDTKVFRLQAGIVFFQYHDLSCPTSCSWHSSAVRSLPSRALSNRTSRTRSLSMTCVILSPSKQQGRFLLARPA